MSSSLKLHDAEQPLLRGDDCSMLPPVNKGRLTLAKVRAVLVPRKKIIFALQAACILFYVVAIFNMGTAQEGRAETGLTKRTVLNGGTCAKQRPQINVFMASFFGGIFAADQLYARNWQLAVPKLLFFVLGGPIAAVATLLTGLSLHGAWWLIDVVMWGVGFYTTDTHWGNPTMGCAVKGW